MIKIMCIRLYDFMSPPLSSFKEKLIESYSIIIFTLGAFSGQTLLYEIYFKVSWGNTIVTNVFRMNANVVRADAIT